MNAESTIHFDDVSVEFSGRAVLRDLSLGLGERRIAVIGSNGSGKSTLARILNGLVTPTRGEVRVHGIDPTRQPKQVRRHVGFIFSNPDAQIIMPTVAEDVALSLRGRGLSRTEIRARVTAELDRFEA